jgi:hypothetical protein
MEKPAKNSKGFILYSPIGNHYFFRVYDKKNKTFKDYKINCEEIEVEILSDYLSLYEQDKNVLDWSSKTLGKNK